MCVLEYGCAFFLRAVVFIGRSTHAELASRSVLRAFWCAILKWPKLIHDAGAQRALTNTYDIYSLNVEYLCINATSRCVYILAYICVCLMMIGARTMRHQRQVLEIICCPPACNNHNDSNVHQRCIRSVGRILDAQFCACCWLIEHCARRVCVFFCSFLFC